MRKVIVYTESDDCNEALGAAGDAYVGLIEKGYKPNRAAKINHDFATGVWNTTRRFEKEEVEAMANYIEQYRIAWVNFGIEDYQSPGKHFMPDQPHDRFRLWVGGCGFGQAKTVDAAREKVWQYAVDSIDERRRKISQEEAELAKVFAALTSPRIGGPVRNRLIPFMQVVEVKAKCFATVK